MTTELFRMEAVENSRQRLYGDVVVVPKIPHATAAAALVCALALLGAALQFGMYVRTQAVQGHLSLAPREEDDGAARAELFVPSRLLAQLKLGQHISLRATDLVADRPVVMDAEIQSFDSAPNIASAAPSAAGVVYMPVGLRVQAASLDRAGVPRGGEYPLRVSADIVVERTTWLRWLLKHVAIHDRKP
jgi:hypothetical protein